MDVERLCAAWDFLEAAKEAGDQPNWADLPGLPLEERVVVLELDIALLDAMVTGARAWEAGARLPQIWRDWS